jgi:hypothetical protein
VRFVFKGYFAAILYAPYGGVTTASIIRVSAPVFLADAEADDAMMPRTKKE